MKRLVVAALTAALTTITLLLAPQAHASTTIPTRTGMDPPFRQGCQVSLTAWAGHWSPKSKSWVASNGQYVQLQIWRNGGWHYLTAVIVHTSNSPAWAIQTTTVHRCTKHTYRAVTPPAWWTTTTYRLGSHSRAKSG